MKSFITIPADQLQNLDFAQLKITNADSAPLNKAGDTALIKWTGDMPDTVANITDKGSVLDHESAMALLITAEWMPEELV